VKKLKLLLFVGLVFFLGSVTVNAAFPRLWYAANYVVLDNLESEKENLILSNEDDIYSIVDMLIDSSSIDNHGYDLSKPYPMITIIYSNQRVKTGPSPHYRDKIYVRFLDTNIIEKDGVVYRVNYDGDAYEYISGLFYETIDDLDYVVNRVGLNVAAETGNAGSSLRMKATNIVSPDDIYYYVKFVNENDVKPESPFDKIDIIDYDYYDITKWKTVSSNGFVSMADDWYLLNGYDRYYVLACNVAECLMSDEAKLISRPELPKLGSRYHVFAFADKSHRLDVFPLFPYMGTNGAHNIKVKIGIIDDHSLLYSLYRNEKDSLDKLTKYAFEHEGQTWSAIDKEFDDVALNGLEVQDGAYYYIYTTYENEDGMYRDLSDISVVMGQGNILVNDVDWTPLDMEENPSTGDIGLLTIAGVAILSGAVAVVVYKKILHS